MPAITLGFAEVEERLERVRRRLNARALAHAGAVAGSALVLVVTGLLVLEFRLAAAAYSVAAWSGVLVAVSVVVFAAVTTYRRWLDSARAAFVADRHGQLADRLTTLVGARAARPQSRLLPTLLAQTLVLGERWQAEKVVPWRLPRSLWWFVAALLALLSTPLFVAQPPPSPMVPSEPAGGILRPTGTAPSPPGQQDAVVLADGEAGDSATEAPGTAPGSVIATDTAQTGGGGAADHPAAPGLGDRAPLQFAARLQQSLARPFRQDPGPPQTAGSQAPLGGVGRMPAPGNAPGGGADDAAQPRQSDAKTGAPANRQQSMGPGSAGDSQAQAGRAGSAAKGRKDRSSSSKPSDSPPAPGAGSGSSPESLLAARGSLPPGDAPRAFKLTLTSFLQAIEQQAPPASPDERRETRGGRGAAGGTQGAAGLNDSQLTNDPIRKAAIPGEYEDLVRRVYSQRPEP